MWLGAAECVTHWAQYNPDRLAIIVNAQKLTFSDFVAGAISVSQKIPGPSKLPQRAGLLFRKKLPFLKALFGAQFRGLSTAILNPALDDESLKITIRDSAAEIFLVDEENQNRLVNLVRASGTAIIIMVDEEIPGDRSFEYAIRDIVREKDPNDEWGVLFSSGSTGVPKAIVQSSYGIMTETLAWCIEMGLTRSDNFYVGRPLFYTGGLVLALATLITRGVLIIDDYSDDEDPGEFLERLEHACISMHINRCFIVPEQVRGICNLDYKWRKKGNPGLILVMGSKISTAEKIAVADLFGCDVVESWGNTEGLGTITDPEDLKARPASIGRPFLSEKLWIMDGDLNSCAIGSHGRLVGSGETMFTEYANRPDATMAAKKKGLVISDDIGYQDNSYYFYIIGREEDVLVLGGVTVVLPEFEERIRELPEVEDVAVVGLRGDKGGVGILVVGAAEHQSRQIEHEILKLAANVYEGKVKFGITVKVVDVVPKLGSGKTDRISVRKVILGQT